MIISANFIGPPGGKLDKLANQIFEQHGGRAPDGRVTGTFLDTGLRHVDSDVPNKKADACQAALKAAGLNVIVGRKAVDKWFEAKVVDTFDK
jgi:hypothetical protein